MSESPELQVKATENYPEWAFIDSWSEWDLSRNSDAEGSRETIAFSNIRSNDWSPSLPRERQGFRMIAPQQKAIVKKHVRKELPAYAWVASMGTLAAVLALLWR